jgi:hypothetical protein
MESVAHWALESPLARHSWYLAAQIDAPIMRKTAAILMVTRREHARRVAMWRLHRPCSARR